MPIAVPVNENSVAQQPLTRARFQAADFGAAGEQIGRAAQGLGKDVQEFAQKQDQINAFYDTAHVKQIDAKVQEEIAPIRASVLNSVGTQAVGAKADALKQLDDVRAKYAATLSNPRQQRMFEDAFTRLQTSEHSTYDEHEAKQSRVAAVAGAAAQYQTNLDRAVDLRPNPEASKAALADALTQIPLANPGAPPEVIKRLGAEALSTYHIGIATAMRDADKDPLEAEHYINENAGAILPKDEMAFRRSIREDVEEAGTDAAYGQVLEEAAQGRTGPPAEDHAQGQDATAQYHGDPLRGRHSAPVAGGGFTAMRDGGRRQHAAEDLPAKIGTPVYPPTAGVVEKVWFDPEGGNSILVKHPDGRVTGYAHLRNANVQQGDHVDADTVIGAVGNTGSASHGAHLHYTVRNADGNRVDPATQTWKAADLPAYSADRVDLQSMYDAARRVATKNNFSPKQYHALISKIDQDAAHNDELRRRNQQDAADAANTVLDRMGDGFTSLTQIPADVRANLKPGALDGYREKAKQNLTGSSVPAGGNTYLQMLEWSGNPAQQDSFVKADLGPLAASMTKPEYESLRKAQIEIRNGGGKQSKIAVEYGRIDSMVNRYAPQTTGLAFQRQMSEKAAQDVRIKRATVTEAVRAQVATAQQKKGAQLSDDELATIVKSQVAPVYVTTPGFFSDTKTAVPRALAPGGRASVRMPVEDRKAIIAAYQRHHQGSMPTEEMIAQTYLNVGGGLK